MAYCYMHLGAFQEAMDKLDVHLQQDPQPEPSGAYILDTILMSV